MNSINWYCCATEHFLCCELHFIIQLSNPTQLVLSSTTSLLMLLEVMQHALLYVIIHLTFSVSLLTHGMCVVKTNKVVVG